MKRNLDDHGPWTLFPGRWQYFHEKHKKLIQKVLDEYRDDNPSLKKGVVIGIRDTPINKENPFTLKERIDFIKKAFLGSPEEAEGRIQVIMLPDIVEICWGRKVGWKPREIRLSPEDEAVSSTKLRKELFGL